MIPRLRIDSYSEDWIEVKIGDLYSNLRTGNTPSRRVKDFFEGHIPWVTSGELNRGKISDTAEKITQEAATSANLKLYPIGTFFMAITGLEAPGTRGKCGIIQVPATTNQSCLAFEESDKVSNRFLFHWYLHNSERLYQKFAQGTKQESYNNKIVASFRIFIPSRKEQNEITHLLDTVDQKMNLLTRKKEALETYKKGLMQKIFSQELRFKREDGSDYPEWEHAKMSSFLSIPKDDKCVKPSESILLTVKLHRKGIVKAKISSASKLAANYKYRKKGQLIFGKQNLFNGAVGIVPEELDGYISSSDIPSMDINHKIINPEYLDSFFSRETYYKSLERYAVGSGSKRIHEKTVLSLIIALPCLEEQQRIVDVVNCIYKNINDLKTAIELNRQLKKGLLQQMFV